ncbi:MAG: hypothetical protein NTV31_00415, partial [Bacteroidia bacterium]|nr:hypothetical protein [Bacteroidia bacterium]
MLQTNYNPDVLTCLANLSNDEVFTPPGLVNDILDFLPGDLWSNPNAKFLDPVCKSGVFLREMAKRLDKGLETTLPDKHQRINHIFKNQLYGIAITELTSLLSRRSLYGSKTANGKYSFCETFTDEQGNIRPGKKCMTNYSLDRLLTEFTMPQPSVFVTRELIKEIGILDERLGYALDFDYFLRAWISDLVHKFQYIPKTIAVSRQHAMTKCSKVGSAKGSNPFTLENLEVLWRWGKTQRSILRRES